MGGMASGAIELGHRSVRNLLAVDKQFRFGMTTQAKFAGAFPEGVWLVTGVWRVTGQAFPGSEWLMFTPICGGVSQTLVTAKTENATLFFRFQKFFLFTSVCLMTTATLASGKGVVEAETAHFLGGGGVAGEAELTFVIGEKFAVL